MTKGDLNRNHDTCRTLLHWFAMNDVFTLIPTVVDLGYAVNERDSEYRTPLHLVVYRKSFTCPRIYY